MLSTENTRGKVIADVGCGAGSFLDILKGFTIGIGEFEALIRIG